MAVQGTFPQQIRSWRAKACLTQAELARRADVSRRTIIRWENGAAEPWENELQRVLGVLQVPPFIGQQQAFDDRLFLRAMRVRAGLSVRDLAARLEVNASTVTRWENHQLFPSLKALAQVYEALAVGEVELLARDAELAVRDVGQLRAHLSRLSLDHDEWFYRLFDLRFLRLLDRIESIGTAEAKPLWAEAKTQYALPLAEFGRYDAARRECRDVLELSASGVLIAKTTLHTAQLLCAWSHLYAGSRTLYRGVALLDELSAAALGSEMLAWRLSLYGEAHSVAGRHEKAIRFAEESFALVRTRPRTSSRRSYDLARIYHRAGRNEEALGAMPQVADPDPLGAAKTCLLQTRVLRELGRRGEASQSSEIAENLIRRNHFPARLGEWA